MPVTIDRWLASPEQTVSSSPTLRIVLEVERQLGQYLAEHPVDGFNAVISVTPDPSHEEAALVAHRPRSRRELFRATILEEDLDDLTSTFQRLMDVLQRDVDRLAAA